MSPNNSKSSTSSWPPVSVSNTEILSAAFAPPPWYSPGGGVLLPAAWTVTPAEIPHCERCGLAAILQFIRASLRQSRCNSGQGAFQSPPSSPVGRGVFNQ
jgi:hypothetical protein